MNRLIASCRRGLARLALRRRPAQALSAPAEAPTPAPQLAPPAEPEPMAEPAPEAADPSAAEAVPAPAALSPELLDTEPGAANALAEPSRGRFAGLIASLRSRWARAPVADQREDEDAEDDFARQPPAPTQPDLRDADETVDVAAPRPNLLARLSNRLRRQAPAIDANADESQDVLHPGRQADDDEALDGDAAPAPGRVRRALAALGNKWIWIPGVSVIVLALLGTMLVLLLQSAQEKQQLEADLLAARQQLEQAGVAKKSASDNNEAAAPAEVVLASRADAAADGYAGSGDADCDVTDHASVTLNLKNCIDRFNDATAKSAR